MALLNTGDLTLNHTPTVLYSHRHMVPPPLGPTLRGDREMEQAVARETDAVLSLCCLVS